MTWIWTATFLALGGFAPAALAAAPAESGQERGPEGASSAAPAVLGAEVRTATATSVSSIYTVDRLRDPFTRWGAGRGVTHRFSMEDFTIKKLSLRGIMTDASSEFALFVDNEAGVSFLLRKGRLYDPKRKEVPGVKGYIQIKQKKVTLESPEDGVVPFHLGEEEQE